MPRFPYLCGLNKVFSSVGGTGRVLSNVGCARDSMFVPSVGGRCARAHGVHFQARRHCWKLPWTRSASSFHPEPREGAPILTNRLLLQGSWASSDTCAQSIWDAGRVMWERQRPEATGPQVRSRSLWGQGAAMLRTHGCFFQDLDIGALPRPGI